MKVTFASQDGRVVQFDVEKSNTLEDVKALLAAEFSVDVEKIRVAYQGDANIPDSALLEDIGVQDFDLFEFATRGERSSRSLSGRVSQSIRNSLSRITSSDVLQQRMIESQINQQEIESNMALAFETSPEAFAQVLMLYVDSKVNGVPVKCFVDSGAQTTVMSVKTAERCGIMRLVDRRFAGVAVGVGTANIIGRVHLAPMQIGKQVYSCSFTVIDSKGAPMDLLLGLDMLKKHRMMIDLKNDCLHIGDDDDVVPFLGEADVPDHAKLSAR